MGYTHYFSHDATTQNKWANILHDCELLAENMPAKIAIAGGNGYGDPVFNRDEIVFNGAGENGHETFAISRGGPVLQPYMDESSMPFAFCKTARKPYDLLVCACLLVYKYHSAATMELSSDGDSEDWTEAENFVQEVLGHEIPYEELRRQ